ncbi:Stk1 family PASTA domain-containing Ser/Thr kinase [Bacillus alkalicellulosilyticus]|uniref:Stk1 family PASTA domain-containing Ser/Thr kinase n=1 Tax=Alkalihalobacterium alkalicellulosilyticum TaxID=1912214 RepID=UPI0009981BEF|nr:Stk1 family PASTA domain-containing Ser/Thr kinase [Bacillus alkalicellulosilyticus]
MIGNRISGRYQILETVGGGGMANVYKAHDVILDRVVAVKVLQPQFSGDEQFIKRFHREAQAATSLAHPNVVSIYDVGVEDDVYYIVMEYVEGPTLKELIQQRGPIPLDETIDIMTQVMSAIAHAHANQIVHRDIKPHNILISTSGEVKVTDFGIARAMSSATITHTNSVMGSVHYLSPEQARGGVVNLKSDIYSLGIVLYEMVTGKLPFSGDTAVSIAIKHLQSDVPSVKQFNASMPQSIENIIKKATAKDPFHRYASVYEMEEDLETALEPSRFNEPVFSIPVDEEATKAMPIIRDTNFSAKDVEKTIEAKQIEEPTKNEPKPKKKKRWVKVTIITILLFFAIVVSAAAFLPNLLKVSDVEVIDVVGMEYEEAEALLEELNLIVEKELVPDDEIPEDEVIRQNPRAGSTVKVNTTVTLYVSEGRALEEMPNLVGFQRSRVERMVDDFEEIEFVERETREYEPGIILSQNPDAGTLLIFEETTVTVTVSVEPQISLENLSGISEEAAREYLRSEELIGKFTSEYSEQVAEGRIISQSPNPFTRVDRGDEIQLVVSKGPEPKPEKEKEKEKENKKEEPKTRQLESVLPIQVEENQKETGVHITIRTNDVNGEKVYVDERIHDSKTYRIPLVVSTEKEAKYDLYVDGQHRGTYSYGY